MGFATVTRAEEIIEAAKTIMRKRNLARARDIIRKKREWVKTKKNEEALSSKKDES